MDIPEKHISEVLILCMAIHKNAALPHAVRVFSITLADKFVNYPELKPELDLIITELKIVPTTTISSMYVRAISKILLKL